jgi:hypothetical protein
MSPHGIPLSCFTALVLACAIPSCATPYGSADDSAELLSRIRVHMRDYVAHLPDYTCRVTLDRSRRPSAQADFELDDRLRLEVAYAGGADEPGGPKPDRPPSSAMSARELYAWPGDDRFENGIADLLPGHGMISDGSYALHTRKLFLSDAARFQPPVEVVCAGEPCIQLDFAVPAFRSGYVLGGSGGSAPAALAGSVWFDRDSLDIRRLLVRVDHPPGTVRIAATREETVYGPVGFGDTLAVLPQSSELLLTDRNGSQSRNRSTFQQCHQYAGTATIFYGTQAVAPSKAPPARMVSLPAGLELELALDDRIGPESAAGDLFTATVTRPGTSRGTTVPVGARVTGRLTRFEHITPQHIAPPHTKDGNRDFWSIGLMLLQVEWPDTIARAPARLRRAPGMKSPRDSILVMGRDPVLPAGLPMTWRVE